MKKKSVDWLLNNESPMLDQFDQFTLKLPSYASKYTLTISQTTAARNDYLWLRYALTCTQQFEQEWRNRVMWKNHLKNGPKSLTAATVPGVGSEFAPPAPSAVADGVLPRWRDLVAYLKNHQVYEKADASWWPPSLFRRS